MPIVILFSYLYLLIRLHPYFITFARLILNKTSHKMKLYTLSLSILCLLLFSCGNRGSKDSTNEQQPQQETTPKFQNKAHELVYNMVQKVGTYTDLLEKKDVVYTYTYITPKNEKDISTEKYLFDGELSYGNYQQHERTLNQFEGPIEQGYDGENFWLKHQGEFIQDDEAMKRVKFNRPTNFYWFTMMQKLMDPGLNYEQLAEDTVDNKIYDVVKITFESQNEKPTDIYQLYINKETGLVDQFLFTVADFGKIETPLLMQLEYEEVDGFLIPTKRKYKLSTWDAEVTEAPWIHVNWTDIKFNNGLTKEDFQ